MEPFINQMISLIDQGKNGAAISRIMEHYSISATIAGKMLDDIFAMHTAETNRNTVITTKTTKETNNPKFSFGQVAYDKRFNDSRKFYIYEIRKRNKADHNEYFGFFITKDGGINDTLEYIGLEKNLEIMEYSTSWGKIIFTENKSTPIFRIGDIVHYKNTGESKKHYYEITGVAKYSDGNYCYNARNTTLYGQTSGDDFPLTNPQNLIRKE